MENVAQLNITDQASWLEKRCRKMVFNVFKQFNFGHLEVIEGEQHFNFGQSCISHSQDMRKRK